MMPATAYLVTTQRIQGNMVSTKTVVARKPEQYILDEGRQQAGPMVVLLMAPIDPAFYEKFRAAGYQTV